MSRLPILLLACALLAGLSAAQSPSISCSASAGLAEELSAKITASVNTAVAANATKVISHGSKSPYVTFTVPQVCVPGNWFGFNLIPEACTKGKTYSGSTGKTTAVYGAFGFTTDITAEQLTCSSSGATGSWATTSAWGTVTMELDLDWYPLVGGSVGVGIELTIKGLEAAVAGTYATSGSPTTGTVCLTSAVATSSSLTYSSISGQFTVTGKPAGALPAKVINKIGAKLTSQGAKIMTKVNTQIAKKVPACATSGSPPVSRSPSPRSPLPSKSPRAG